MKIIIVGCGKVGAALTAQLSKEDHNITIIDTDYDVVRNISNTYDVMGIAGNGVSYNVLQEAGIRTADLLIAVTYGDELNLLCCVIAKQAGHCHTIARVRNPIYRREQHHIRKVMGVSMIINPEAAAAREIARLMQFPSAIEVNSFTKGRIDMLRLRVPTGSKITGFALKDFSRMTQSEVLVCVVERKGEVYIPDGNFIIREGDTVSIIATARNANDFFRRIGVRNDQIQSAMIVGGGELAYYLTQSLLSMGVAVKIVEKNRTRCEELAELFPKATIIHGDGSDRELLQEEKLHEMDAFIACTDMDEENIVLSLYARDRVRTKVVTKINHLEFNDVIYSLSLDSLIYPKHITAETILQYVRAMENSIGSNVETLYKLLDDRVEALEFLISKECRLAGIRLQDMKTRPNLLVAGISRNGELIIPGGQDYFEAGDTVIVVTTWTGLQDINDIVTE